MDEERGVGQMNSTLVNLSFDAVTYLRDHLGYRYRSQVESIMLTVVYCAILLTGVTGNVSTCIVIIRNNYLHTATNFYLFSLAISDVLTLVLGLPPELYTVWEAYPWRFGEPYCLFKTFLTEMTSSASILTITSFTVERFVAICHPLKTQAMSSLPRALKTIVLIWLAACLTALPYPAHTRTFYYLTDPVTNTSIAESLICNIPLDWVPQMRFVFQSSTFLLFILPIILITVLYVLIGITLRKSGVTRDSMRVASGSPHQAQSRKSVLKMLVAVVVAFFICWAPFHGQRLMTTYVQDDQWTAALLETQSLLFYVSGILYYVSSTVNPILYNLMSARYRKAFRETLVSCRSKNTKGRRRLTTGTSAEAAAAADQRFLSSRSVTVTRASNSRRRQLKSTLTSDIQPSWQTKINTPNCVCIEKKHQISRGGGEEGVGGRGGQERGEGGGNTESILLQTALRRTGSSSSYSQFYYIDRGLQRDPEKEIADDTKTGTLTTEQEQRNKAR